MNELNGYDIEDLKEGMSATFAKTITETGSCRLDGASCCAVARLVILQIGRAHV